MFGTLFTAVIAHAGLVIVQNPVISVVAMETVSVCESQCYTHVQY